MKKTRNKNRLLGLLTISVFSVSAILTTSLTINHQSSLSSIETTSYRNYTKEVSTTDKATLSTTSYIPVLSSQFAAPAITDKGWIGTGTSTRILNNEGNVVNDDNGNPLSDSRRKVTFTTFDGNLRWAFDLNDLANTSIAGSVETCDLRVVDVKPLYNEGYLVLAAATGKKCTSYEDNVLFMLDQKGQYIENSINFFNLPSFGTPQQLVGNTSRNIKIISPYSIKLTRVSATSVQVQISANPLAIKKVDGGNDRINIEDYFQKEATTNSFDPDSSDNDVIKTGPVVLLRYDLRSKSFEYHEQGQNAKKVLKNYAPFSAFSNFDTSGLFSGKVLSDLVFYVKNNALGFYGVILKSASDSSYVLDISSYIMRTDKFVLSNNIKSEKLGGTTHSSYDNLLDYQGSDYSGIAYSLSPLNYESPYNSPGVQMVIPFLDGFYFFSIFDDVITGERVFQNWTINSSSLMSNGIYLDPLYGALTVMTKDKKLQFIDTTYETSGGNSIPNLFQYKEFNITSSISDFNNFIQNVNNIIPISESNNIYSTNSSFYGKFNFACFNNGGGYKVLSFAPSSNLSSTTVSVLPSESTNYALYTFTNLQARSEVLEWTPKKKKISEIADERLSSIGDFKSVSDSTPIDQLPLFYATYSDADNVLYPILNKVQTSNIVRDYENSLISFTSTFSYNIFGESQPATISLDYKISDFKKDPTIFSSTSYDIPHLTTDNNPLIISSPLSYQGYYNSRYNYKSGDQVAINEPSLGSTTYVYQLKKDKPTSAKLYKDTDGSFDRAVFNEYFENVYQLNSTTDKQTPYEAKKVEGFKGEYNSKVKYYAGDIVRDTVSNKLYIFNQTSSSLTSASIYPGTDLSVLLPTDLTTNHIAMIIASNMIAGTIPNNFNNSDIEVTNPTYDNLGTNSPIHKGMITANVRLYRYYDENGGLVSSNTNFPDTVVNINFGISSLPTTMTTQYTVSDFGDLLTDKYAYELDNTFLSSNLSFGEYLAKINVNNGNWSSDISVSNIVYQGTQANNAEGYSDIQVGLSRWYNNNGVLVTSEIKYFYIRISGFKKAEATELSTSKVILKSDQTNIPGFTTTPGETTVSEFIKSKANLQNFINNYIDPTSNTPLISVNAKPTGFDTNSVIIKNTTPNSNNGEVIVTFTLSKYFEQVQNNILYRDSASKLFTLTISGLKPFVDNTIDTYNYFASIDITSSVINQPAWPSQLYFRSAANIPIASQIVDKYTDEIVINTILSQAVIAYVSASTIDSVQNNNHIVGFGVNDIGQISSWTYNNFTGKIIFKINLKQIGYLSEDGSIAVLDNSITYPDWQTNSACSYEFAITGFEKVIPSTTLGERLPYPVSTDSSGNVVLSADFNLKNKNILQLSYNDLKDQITFGGSFIVKDGDELKVLAPSEVGKLFSYIDQQYIEKNVIDGKATIYIQFNKDIYYFAENGDLPSNNPFLNGNVGTPILLKAGSKIQINVTNASKAFNSWEIIFWIGVGVVSFILLSLIILLIAKAAHRRKIY